MIYYVVVIIKRMELTLFIRTVSGELTWVSIRLAPIDFCKIQTTESNDTNEANISLSNKNLAIPIP